MVPSWILPSRSRIYYTTWMVVREREGTSTDLTLKSRVSWFSCSRIQVIWLSFSSLALLKIIQIASFQFVRHSPNMTQVRGFMDLLPAICNITVFGFCYGVVIHAAKGSPLNCPSLTFFISTSSWFLADSKESGSRIWLYWDSVTRRFWVRVYMNRYHIDWRWK